MGSISAEARAPVITRLKGGLGNQLFQYCAGYSLARQTGRELVLDVAWFGKSRTRRKFHLPQLGIEATHCARSKASRFAMRLNPAVAYFSEHPQYEYQPFNEKGNGPVYLDGYWQAEQYFAPVREELRSRIRPELIPAGEHETPYPSDSSIAVHVRRGDYLKAGASQVLPKQYFRDAMAEFGRKADFMFFSDDIAWCRQEFSAENVEFSSNATDLQDFRQMSRAAHHIISNSTFAWWSAWLNSNPTQIVIAPRPWTRQGTHADILPSAWRTVPAKF